MAERSQFGPIAVRVDDSERSIRVCIFSFGACRESAATPVYHDDGLESEIDYRQMMGRKGNISFKVTGQRRNQGTGGAGSTSFRFSAGIVVPQKDLLDALPEGAGDAEGQAEARLILAVLHGDDRLTGDADPGGQLGLGLIHFRAQDAHAILHR